LASTKLSHAAAHAAMVGEPLRKGPFSAGLLAAHVLPTEREVWSAIRSTGRALLTWERAACDEWHEYCWADSRRRCAPLL
jgi:hypothetical protein